MSIERIIVGHDGSAGADHACRWAGPLAAQLGAEVVVVQGYDPLGELGKAQPPVDFAALEAEAAEQLAEHTGELLAPAGVSSRVVLVEAHGVAAIVKVAREEDAGLVVVGSHGRTGWRERILGRVAMRLPQESPCPVVIVPQPRPSETSSTPA